MHLDVALSLELSPDGTVSGTWAKITKRLESASAPLMYVKNSSLNVFGATDINIRELVHLSRGINVMLEAARLPELPFHDYFRIHLGAIPWSTKVEQLERIISRDDFMATFLRASGGGPGLCKAVIKYVPKLRELLTAR